MKHILPPLPYDLAPLEPHVDARTMMLHHNQHHASYVANLNAALEKFPALQARSALWLLLNSGEVPESIRTVVRNNAGGHVNHSLFWRVMSPARGSVPAGPLAVAINEAFGSLGQFKARFVEAGGKVFGSGWVWLARAQRDGGALQVLTTPGHDNPLMEGHYPLLVIDVWEHAYYLKHENRRRHRRRFHIEVNEHECFSRSNLSTIRPRLFTQPNSRARWMASSPSPARRASRNSPQSPNSDSTKLKRGHPVLYTIAVVLLILWLLGLVTSTTMGGLIHVLIVIAVVVVLLRIISGRRVL